MKERIDIVVPEDELDRNPEKTERLRATRSFLAADRVPVVIGVSQWTELAARGRTTTDYIRPHRYIETLGRKGGYILDCGCGTAPGTPPGHFRAMVEASVQAGCIVDGG